MSCIALTQLVHQGQLLLTLAAPFFLLNLSSLASWVKRKSFEESKLKVAKDLKEVRKFDVQMHCFNVYFSVNHIYSFHSRISRSPQRRGRTKNLPPHFPGLENPKVEAACARRSSPCNLGSLSTAQVSAPIYFLSKQYFHCILAAMRTSPTSSIQKQGHWCASIL